MAIVAQGMGVRTGRGLMFEEVILPRAPIDRGGIFKCCHCGLERAAGDGVAPPPHAHAEDLVPVRWRLVIAAEGEQRIISFGSARDRRALGRGGDGGEPGSPAASKALRS